MERVIILKNTDTGQTLTLPVTPPSYPMGTGRAVERLDMAQTGQIALPGLQSLFTGTLEFWLPARSYPFLTAEAVTDPQYYIDLLAAWSAAANVCRYIVTGTAVNIPVLLGPLEYGEEEGTNDVQCKLPLYEYRYLEEARAETVTQNKARAMEAASEPKTADQYTVAKGDSLWAICKKFYGDGSLAYRLATANGVKNPNLIYPGQVLTLPDKAALAGYEATPAPAVGVSAQPAKDQSAEDQPREAAGESSGKLAQRQTQAAAERAAVRAEQRALLKLKVK